jgi:penicillin-insensitive murein endopeptidase
MTARGMISKRLLRILSLAVAFCSTSQVLTAAENAPTSTCYGTTAKGRLEYGWQLPSSGENFSAYSLLGVGAGRNYLHSEVQKIVVETYAELQRKAPSKLFVYGETGWEEGGQFRPHKTHQNGLSVDFFVPVLNSDGESEALPTNTFNKFGYNIEFSQQGQYDDYRIDYDAMALHLLTLKQVADRHGVKVWRVIFDNTLQKQLFATQYGTDLQAALTFSKKKPWVRHDEHYHVDFELPCE